MNFTEFVSITMPLCGFLGLIVICCLVAANAGDE